MIGLSRIEKAYWLLVPTVLHATLPWVQYRVRAIVPFVFFCIWLCCVRKNITRNFMTRIVQAPFWSYFLLYVLVTSLSTIYWLFGYGEPIKYYKLAVALNSFSHCVILYISIRGGKIRELKMLSVLALLGLSLSGIGSFQVGEMEGLEGARSMLGDMSSHTYDMESAMLARMVGASGYATCYNDAIFLVAVLWGLALIKNWWYRFFMACAAGAVALAIRNSGLGTPVFLMLYSLFLFGLSLLRLKPRTVFLLGSLVCLSLIIYSYHPTFFSFVGWPVDALSKAFPEGSSIHGRLISVVKALNGDTSAYAYTRYQLQVRSIDAFLSNPCFGCGIFSIPDERAHMVGGHSTFLDLLGQAGLIGGFLFLSMLIAVYVFMKRVGVVFGLSRSYGAVIMAFVMSYLFATIANPVPFFPAYCYYIPGIGLLISDYRVKKRCPNPYRYM